MTVSALSPCPAIRSLRSWSECKMLKPCVCRTKRGMPAASGKIAAASEGGGGFSANAPRISAGHQIIRNYNGVPTKGRAWWWCDLAPIGSAQGGSWYFSAGNCRSAYRFNSDQGATATSTPIFTSLKRCSYLPRYHFTTCEWC